MDYPENEINIVLLGETGVGKSTFINAFVNYLNFATIEEIERKTPYCLIPTSFVHTDNSNRSVTVTFGSDDNESKDVLKGESATQMCRDYLFETDNISIRFTDTPGLADTRGIEQDRINLENILSAIGAHDHLNAICILLKPNMPRLTTSFKYVVTQLLSQLEKSAANNIIFVYTNSRGTNFKVGDTITPLKNFLSEIKEQLGISIPHDKNVFCFDNEAFRFVLAVQQNVEFSKRERRGFEDSWEESVEQCKKLVNYVIRGPDDTKLVPHSTRGTVSIFEARRMIKALKKPTQEISEQIQMNISALEKEEGKIKNFDGDIKKLVDKYAIPIIETKTTELPEPHCACTSKKCRKHVKLSSGTIYTHYPQICYDMKNAPKDSFAHAMRVGFSYTPIFYLLPNFTWDRICKECECSMSFHEIFNYKTEVTERKDDSLRKELEKKKSSKEIQQYMVRGLQERSNAIERELNFIMDTTSKFACFLKKNAIIPQSDHYENYIKEAIENEEMKQLSEIRDEQIKRYKKMLDDYNEMKVDFEKATKEGKEKKITTNDVYELINQLYKLPLFGSTIKQICSIQDRSDRKATQRLQVIHNLKGLDLVATASELYSYVMSFMH